MDRAKRWAESPLLALLFLNLMMTDEIEVRWNMLKDKAVYSNNSQIGTVGQLCLTVILS